MNKEEFKKLKEEVEEAKIRGIIRRNNGEINSEMNSEIAQYRLGYAYYAGDGVTKNYKLAVEWFRKAAWRGCESSHLYLAYCYRDGTGVEKDLNQAAEHFERAARNGDRTALSNLGLCYLNGDGVRKNLKKAKELFNRARGTRTRPEPAERSCSCCYCRRNG